MSRSVEKLIRRMVAPNADVRCLASDALDDPYWIPKEVLKSTQKAAHRTVVRSRFRRASLTTLPAHIGKSASLSQAAFSAMNIDVDTSRLLDIVSPFTTRTLKDRKGGDKENVTKVVPSAPTRKPDIKSDFVIVESSEVLKKVRINAADQSSSSAASSSKKKHVRSQSQPKAAVKSGLLPAFSSLTVLTSVSSSATIQSHQRPPAQISRP